MKSLRLSDLVGLSKHERNRKLSELIVETRQPPSPELLAAADARIAAHEAAHGMTSDEMKQRLHAGEISETLAVCQWLMDLDMREHLARAPVIGSVVSRSEP